MQTYEVNEEQRALLVRLLVQREEMVDSLLNRFPDEADTLSLDTEHAAIIDALVALNAI